MVNVLRAIVLAACLSAALPTGAVGPGSAVPTIAMTRLDGSKGAVSIDRMRGRVVYVDFWASWCAPCKRSFPWMNEMARKYGSRGLTIVAVNVDKKREDAEKFLKMAPAEFTVVYDPAGKSPSAWQVTSMPSSYLVDAAGTVVLVENGFKDERKADVEQHIRAALGVR